jgi:twinkle protein
MQWFIDAYQKRFRLWGRIGITQHLQILGLVRQLAEQGIRHVVIDSLMCLDIANDDTEAQRRFANLLANTARASNVHIHLVAHPRKLQSAEQELDLNDVAGAREIGGIADNVIFIRRSKTKDGYLVNAESTPMCVSVRKQRHFSGALGDVEGWFQRKHRQFSREQFIDQPQRYLPEDAFVTLEEQGRNTCER